MFSGWEGEGLPSTMMNNVSNGNDDDDGRVAKIDRLAFNRAAKNKYRYASPA